jgi:hypothetical protein
MFTKYWVSAVTVALLSAGAYGDNGFPPPSVRVLLPITVDHAAGAFGTVWDSEIRTYRDVVQSVATYPEGCPWSVPVGDDLQPCDNPHADFPFEVRRVGFFPTQPGETPGAFLYVDREQRDHVDLSLIITGGGSIPVQVPVVWEDEFSSGAVHLFGVPDVGGRRIALRVYGSDPEVVGNVRIRVLAEPGQEVLAERVVPLTVVQRYYSQTTVIQRLPLRPPYAQIDFQAPLTPTADTVHYEITPLTPNLRIWAFASITDNLTQQVVLRTPR